MGARIPGLSQSSAAEAARKGAKPDESMIQCQNCKENWPTPRYEMSRGGDRRIHTCPRCSYIGRFNKANRMAALLGEDLPLWGHWQPNPPFDNYQPWTGRADGPSRMPTGCSTDYLRRAPRGFVLDGSRAVPIKTPDPEPEGKPVQGDLLDQPSHEQRLRHKPSLVIEKALELYREGYRLPEFEAMGRVCVGLDVAFDGYPR